MLTKKHVEIILSKLKNNPNPKPSLEQYEINSNLAAEIVNLAYISGDIKNKIVLDLGCGSGKLAIASSFFKPKKVYGIDIDEKAIKIAIENVKIAEKISGIRIGKKIEFLRMDVSNWAERVDTVVQNPPFGIQNKHADRIFLEKALECSRKVYSLHRSYHKSREFLTKFVEKRGGSVERIVKFEFRLPHTFRFHSRPVVKFDVDLFVFNKIE
ncbi:MAG: METTL5 family protein [Candidatus Aenigmatarchaeota archaeon]